MLRHNASHLLYRRYDNNRRSDIRAASASSASIGKSTLVVSMALLDWLLGWAVLLIVNVMLWDMWRREKDKTKGVFL